MKCDFRASFLARTFANPYLGRKPKARVATKMLFVLVHLCVLCPTTTTHPTCVFLSLENDTHIIGFYIKCGSLFFSQLQEEFSTLRFSM
jgi:hypothetical protein